MREILFRAKQHYTKEWLYGAVVKDGDECLITVGEPDGLYKQKMTVVEESTVGQFTGLVDRNGKRIFEGDILLTNGMDGKLLWVSYFDDEEAQFDFCPLGHEYCSTHNELYYSSKRQIIGNIHDNPELVEAR
jgi:uncharacterized phage protein (TIGR01671 family)